MRYRRATCRVGARGPVTCPPINALNRTDIEDGVNRMCDTACRITTAVMEYEVAVVMVNMTTERVVS